MKVIITGVKLKETEKSQQVKLVCKDECGLFWGHKSVWVPKSVFNTLQSGLCITMAVDSWFYKKSMNNLSDLGVG